MDKIYEYGSEETQPNPNTIWNGYELIREKMGLNKDLSIEDGSNKDIRIGSKVTGAFVAELFRKNVEIVLYNKYKNKYKISENNVYVKGCNIEFDFLILRADAKKELIDQNGMEFEIPIYDVEDVVAVLESKTYGIYSLYNRDAKDFEKNNLYKFVNAYKNDLLGLERGIKLGYMCLAEQRPKCGKSNFIEKTIYFFEDYFECKYNDKARLWNVYYAKCHYANKESDLYAREEQWERFVESLI